MKLAIVLFGLSTTDLAQGSAILARSPVETAPGAKIWDLIREGISGWGPGGGIRVEKYFPRGGGAPWKNMIGGLPELRRPKRPVSTRPGTPGEPLGPRKKKKELPPWTGCSHKRDLTCAEPESPLGVSPAELGEDGEQKTKKRKTNRKLSRISDNKFLQFVAETNPEDFESFFDELLKGKLTVADCLLAFKRAVSETIDARWTDFGNGETAMRTISNLVLDGYSTLRFKAPSGFWRDVLTRLVVIAREIHKATTYDEKMAIAEENINMVTQAWSKTPLGVFNRILMEGAAKDEPVAKSAALGIHEVWSEYTLFGLLMNKVLPIKKWIRGTSHREVKPRPWTGPADDDEEPYVEKVPENTGRCSDSTGRIPCGGGQNSRELDVGWHVCSTCGFAWDPEGGKCRTDTGRLIWPAVARVSLPDRFAPMMTDRY
ncbi:hypothetical protein HIM_05291 [Hirsutella minnesotensis 3608]|uniref:Uncharacterized protein n=1 Tax=Hirsutella minnesotensis 3608 TaxID=1043627 RepID=A0A0F7ZPE6_9HYPO|nr:hypothetical protein HIM_05291 [Hirsutella minnesotensis 3608]